MKTARERAEDAALVCGVDESHPMRGRVVSSILPMFRQYGCDQRHLCAEAASEAAVRGGNEYLAASDAHAAAMNTPFPGEEKDG